MSVTANPRINPVATYQFDVVFGADNGPGLRDPRRIFNQCPASRRREWTAMLRHIRTDATGTVFNASGRASCTLLATKGTPTFGRLSTHGGSEQLSVPTTVSKIATAGEWAGLTTIGQPSSGSGINGWGQIWVGGAAQGVFPVGGVAQAAGPTGTFCVSPDGRWIFGTTGVNVIKAFPVIREDAQMSTGLRVGTAISDPGTAPTVGTIQSVAASPDGLSVVITGSTTPFIEAYAFDPVAGAWGAKASAPGSLPAGIPQTVRFSPDGTMIALGHATSPFVSLYAWTGTAFGNKASNPGALPATEVVCVAWHPLSTYLLCAVNSASTTANTRTYPITGGATPAFGTAVTATTTSANAAYSAAWAGDGNQVAVAIGTSNVVNVIPWTGSAYGTAISMAGETAATNDRGMLYDASGSCFWLCSSATSVKRNHSVSSTTNEIDPWLPSTISRYVGNLITPKNGDATTWYSGWSTPITFEQGASEEIWMRGATSAQDIGGHLLCSVKEYDL